ncbi:MAG: RidA family protein [Thermomicrobiales bacterium]
MKIEAKLEEMGLTLPPVGTYASPQTGPPVPVVVRNGIAYVSGHSSRAIDGKGAAPKGAVPSKVSPDDAREAAKGAGLTILTQLKEELGDLDRISKWLYVAGMVNADPGFDRTSYVIGGFSEFIIELFGPEIGNHARSAAGHSTLAGNSCVIVAAWVEVDGHDTE